MKKGTKNLLAMALTVMISAGCASNYEQAGALTGAAVGAAVGSTIGDGRGKALAIWLGAVTGAAIGSTVGKYMDEQDRMRTADVLETKRTNTATTWVNPDTQNTYTVTPTRTYTVAEGPCREFTLDAQIGGQNRQERNEQLIVDAGQE